METTNLYQLLPILYFCGSGLMFIGIASFEGLGEIGVYKFLSLVLFWPFWFFAWVVKMFILTFRFIREYVK
jgi:hypothetical protein